MNIKIKKVAGYTLIEVLVTISIITVLSSIVSVSVVQYREKSKTAKATAETRKIRDAIFLLYNDTGKYPNGCDAEKIYDKKVYLNTKESGLFEKPIAGSYGKCEWENDDLSGWNGPYFPVAGSVDKTLIDPWEKPYYIDFDYYGYSGFPSAGPGCPSKFSNGIAVVSRGPDDKTYDCNDVASYIKDCGSQKLEDCL